MREPRPGIGWSTGRIARRGRYATWMSTPAWHNFRRGWLAWWVDGQGREPICQACGSPWTLRDGDLHHRSYRRLGHEDYRDVIPLCRDCHTRWHTLFESNPAWQRLGRPLATDVLVAALRRRQSTPRSTP